MSKAGERILEGAREAVVPDEWRGIGTAPKDGTWIIVRLGNGEVFRACWYLYGPPGWHVATDIGFVNPTHWLPMPPPPQ